MMPRGHNVFAPRVILPKVMSGSPPTAVSDYFLYALFARLALNNNETVEFETKYDPSTNTIELIIPDEAKQFFSQLTGMQRGPNFKLFTNWLIGSDELKPEVQDPNFIPSTAMSIWFGSVVSPYGYGVNDVVGNKTVITLSNAEESIVGYNFKITEQLSGNMQVYLVWTFTGGANTSFDIRCTAQINNESGSTTTSSDTNISTFNLISGDIRETLITSLDVEPEDLINLLIYRNYTGSPDPKTEGVGVLGLRLKKI